MKMDTCCYTVLEILKNSSTGVTPTAVINAAKDRGVKHPLPAIKTLIDEGLARIDEGKNGRPHRLKALPKAWQL